MTAQQPGDVVERLEEWKNCWPDKHSLTLLHKDAIALIQSRDAELARLRDKETHLVFELGAADRNLNELRALVKYLHAERDALRHCFNMVQSTTNTIHGFSTNSERATALERVHHITRAALAKPTGEPMP